MTAIAGFWSFGGRFDSARLCRAMIDAQARYGLRESAAVLGDLALAADQRLAVVFVFRKEGVEPSGDGEVVEPGGGLARAVNRLRGDDGLALLGRIEPVLAAPEAGDRGHDKAPRPKAGGLETGLQLGLGALVAAAAVRRRAALALGSAGLEATELRLNPVTLNVILRLVHRCISLLMRVLVSLGKVAISQRV